MERCCRDVPNPLYPREASFLPNVQVYRLWVVVLFFFACARNYLDPLTGVRREKKTTLKDSIDIGRLFPGAGYINE